MTKSGFLLLILVIVFIFCSNISAKTPKGIVIIEAESTKSGLDLWKLVTTTDSNYVKGASEKKHLEFTGGTINGGKPTSPIEYNFKVPNNGTYRLLIVCRKRLEGVPGDKCNDGWVKMDGNFESGNDIPVADLKKEEKFFGGIANGWGWGDLLDWQGHIKRPALYNLKAGENYKFTLSGRSVRWNVDRIVFFDTLKFKIDEVKNMIIPLKNENNTTITQNAAYKFNIDIDSICVHDPCILADPVTKLYYLYGNYEPNRKWSRVEFPNKRAGVQAYISKDLKEWSLPKIVFEVPDGFWGDKEDAPWAPEVHYYNNKYYLFVTFNKLDSIMDVRADRPKITLRASQILVADSPLGPFKPFENRQTTLDGDMTLDATLYSENGEPYIVYCHEWVQKGVGTIDALKLTSDLSKPVGKPFQVISASEVNWDKDTINYKNVPAYGSVTDGCYFYRTKTGKLLLLWSSWHRTRQYAQTYAISENGTIKGPWKHINEPILTDDRGHGMIFKGFDGKLYLCLHRYFHSPATRVQIWEVKDTGDGLEIIGQSFGAK